MNINDEIMDSIKEGDLAGLQAELIGCLDIDATNGESPKTLALAEAIAEKLPENLCLFEEDNGHFNFASAELDKETLTNIKGRLRVNFSKEKLVFACKLIASLNRLPDLSIATLQTDEDLIKKSTAIVEPDITSDQVTEIVDSQEAISELTPDQDQAAEIAKQDITTTEIIDSQEAISELPSDQDQTAEIVKQDIATTENKKLEMPKKPIAPIPEKPSFETESTQKAKPQLPPSKTQERSSKQSTPQKTMKRPGVWEKRFGKVGRCIDEFIKRLRK